MLTTLCFSLWCPSNWGISACCTATVRVPSLLRAACQVCDVSGRGAENGSCVSDDIIAIIDFLSCAHDTGVHLSAANPGQRSADANQSEAQNGVEPLCSFSVCSTSSVRFFFLFPPKSCLFSCFHLLSNSFPALFGINTSEKGLT